MPQQQNVEVTAVAPGRLDVRGALTFATARAAYEAGLRAMRSKAGASNGPLLVDCAGVALSDSAGLAVLIEWLAAAARVGRAVRFSNLPEGIRAAAEISGVSDLLEPAA